MTDKLFKTYERTKVERMQVTTVTEENISELARLVRGQVDYRGASPVLIAKLETGGTWSVPLGFQVSLITDGDLHRLQNQNGFNSGGTWKEVSDDA